MKVKMYLNWSQNFDENLVKMYHVTKTFYDPNNKITLYYTEEDVTALAKIVGQDDEGNRFYAIPNIAVVSLQMTDSEPSEDFKAFMASKTKIPDTELTLQAALELAFSRKVLNKRSLNFVSFVITNEKVRTDVNVVEALKSISLNTFKAYEGFGIGTEESVKNLYRHFSLTLL